MVAVECHGKRRDEIRWARDDSGIAIPFSDRGILEPRIGFEPITDNPTSSAHQSAGEQL
jgi:hypothetical protein